MTTTRHMLVSVYSGRQLRQHTAEASILQCMVEEKMKENKDIIETAAESRVYSVNIITHVLP